jgi:broad specificity phosphatase PhoE
MIAQLKSPQIQSDLSGYNLPTVPANSTRVILLRHGRSTLNDQGRFQGSSDSSDLTSQGVAASEMVGDYLAHYPIEAVYVSPLKRAKHTLNALLPRLRTSMSKGVTTSPLLQEIHLPAWAGRLYEEVRSQHPDAYRCWQETPDQFQMPLFQNDQPAQAPTTEFYPVREVYQRAQQFWHSVLPAHQGQTILVVGHGSTNQALINTALQLSPREHHALQQTHSGLTVLDLASPPLTQPAQVHILNQTVADRTPPRLPKLKASQHGLRLVLLPCEPDKPLDLALTAFFQAELIQAAIVEDGPQTPAAHQPACRQVAQSFLHHHPETVTLSLQRSHFWQQWEAAIQGSLRTQRHDQLTTVLAIARPESLQPFLNQLLSLPPETNALPLRPHTLSVIHYPNPQTRPILQGLNLKPISAE